jgi:hypothetical protein
MRYEIIFPILFAGLPHAAVAKLCGLSFHFNVTELKHFNPVAQAASLAPSPVARTPCGMCAA